MKVKTHSSCKKRFRKTARGLIKRSSAYRRHHSWSKTSKQVRNLRGISYVDSSQEKKILTLMPY